MSDDSKTLGDNAGVYLPQDDPGDESPAIDFGGFIISLGTSAYVSLGKVDHPDLADQPKDLGAAKNVIDILEMLQSKTDGNLEPEEDRLLTGLIYELKLAFVEAK